MIIGISSAFVYFYWLKKKIISVQYISLAATYENVKMLYSNKTNLSERTDVNKSNKSKECMTCHY